MIIDSKHRAWACLAGSSAGVGLTCYIFYSRAALHGPSGGSVPGLIFGILAYLAILFATGLSLRRMVPTWRIGSGQSWLRAHIWISLLSVPLVCFHAGFTVGGSLATVVTALFMVVILSGILGLIVQQFLPSRIKSTVPLETVFAQINLDLERLRLEARARYERTLQAMLASQVEVAVVKASVSPDTNEKQEPHAALTPIEGQQALLEFYETKVEPYLSGDPAFQSLDREKLQPSIAQVKVMTSPEIDQSIDDLVSICEERRQLLSQMKLHGWLHDWLKVHGPLSMILVILVSLHAILAIQY